MTDSTVTARPYVLLDAAGKIIPQDMLNCSTSSISVSVDIYPCRDIPVSNDRESVIIGTPAEGYEVQSVTIQPQSIQVAAEKDLLDSLDRLVIEPVSVEGASQSFSAKSTVTQLSDFKNVSSEQVYVNVTIVEEQVTDYVDNVRVIFTGKAENLIASYDQLGVEVTGPRSGVARLAEEGVTVTVDLAGLGEGYYILSPQIDGQAYEGFTIMSEAASVTLTDITYDESADGEEAIDYGALTEDE
jgi:YbbR domain-containing protein